jgi:outer membrane receptor protein involved in Fe transport
VHQLIPNNIIANLDGAGTRGQTSPLFTYNDTVSWTKAKHAFKAGFELRFSSSDGFNGAENPEFILPGVTIGVSGPSVTGISTIPGLVGTNVTTAQNLLLDLSGSVGNVSRGYEIRKATDTFIPVSRRRDFHQNEWGAFFKDDWKVRQNLTLNVGVRYDYYGVPWEKFGAIPRPVGGEAGCSGFRARASPTCGNPEGSTGP